MNDDRMDVLLRAWGTYERDAAGPVPAALVARAAAAPERPRRAPSLRVLLPLAAAASVVAVVAGAALVGSPAPAERASAPPVRQDPRVLYTDAEDMPNCPDCAEPQTLYIYSPQLDTSTPLTVAGPDGPVVATSGTGDGATFYIARLLPGECRSVVLRLEVRDAGRAVQSELFRPDGAVYELSISPDGKTLAYVSTRRQPGTVERGCGRAEVRLRDLTQGTERALSPQAADEDARQGVEGAVLAGSLSWSPVGDRLLFIGQECCQTTTTLYSLRPGVPGPLEREVVLRDSDVACFLRAVVQRHDDLLIGAEGCRGEGRGIQLIVWNAKDRSAHRLPTGVSTTNLSYRNGKVLAERDGAIGLLADDGRFTRLAAGYSPAW